MNEKFWDRVIGWVRSGLELAGLAKSQHDPLRYKVKIFRRTVVILQRVFNRRQFHHIMELLSRLDEFRDVDMRCDLDLEKCSTWLLDYYVLRDRGGPLGREKIQLVFYVDEAANEIIVVRSYRGWTRYFNDPEREKIESLYAQHMTNGRRLSVSVRRVLDTIEPHLDPSAS